MEKNLAFLLIWAMVSGELSGAEQIRIYGSDTLGAKMVPLLAESYHKQGREVVFNIQAEGSASAFAALLAETCDIGMSARKAKPGELEAFRKIGKTLIPQIAAYNRMVIAVQENVRIKGLTLKQVDGIFTGILEDWSEVGDHSGKIIPLARNPVSGTYMHFKYMAMGGKDYGKNVQKLVTDQYVQALSTTPDSIGYLGLAHMNQLGIRPLKIEGISPDDGNPMKYPLTSPVYFYTTNHLNTEAKAFLHWAKTSKEAKMVIENVGFIPCDSAE
jgi:phosphate transport system substrate-binding protein